MKPGAAYLALLRTNSETAVKSFGFIMRGAILSGGAGAGCTLACSRFNLSSVYQIDVAAGAGDWFMPYTHGQALFCDVPKGQPNGTLVVTHAMNGCALEVRDNGISNRFYHDADGNSLPADPLHPNKIRVAYQGYAGAAEPTHEESLRYFGPDNFMRDEPNMGGYEHSIICVKSGANWLVFASAVIRLKRAQDPTYDAWQVKAGVPYDLGSFAD